MVCIFGSQVLNAQPKSTEYEVKATLLFNFCHFVQWPGTAFADANIPATFYGEITGDVEDRTVKSVSPYTRFLQINSLALG